MALKTRPFDVTEYLDDDETIAAYLTAVFRDGDPALIAAALGDVAKARGMSQIAKESGVSREALYGSLSEDGNPKLSTLTRVISALGLELSVRPKAV